LRLNESKIPWADLLDFRMRSKSGPGWLQRLCFDLPTSPVIPGTGEAASTPCSPKAEAARGPRYPHTLLSLSHTHTHTGLSFESPGLDLKFLFRACHAFYMHVELERERRDGGWSPNELPLSRLLVPSGIYVYTSTHTHALTHTHTHTHTHTYHHVLSLLTHTHT